MLSYSYYQVKPGVSLIAHAMFGIMTPFQDEYNDAMKSLKEQIKGINTRLNGKTWLVGTQCTLADIYLAGLLTSVFQTCLDAGFMKAMSNVAAWFTRVSRLPAFVRAFGYIKLC